MVGTNVYNQRENRFEFRPGPVFANVVLVDEVNRASPKTQSGLLECMQERHVTVDKHTHELARPFLVVATQNPVEYEGTYPLPEAQLDRFMVRVSLGYPTADQEAAMLLEHAESDRVLDLETVADVADVLAGQAAAGAVHGSEALRRYVVSICEATRADSRVDLGASPRAGLMLLPRGQGLRGARRSRPCAAGRRPEARLLRALAPAAAFPGRWQRRARRRGPRRAGAGPRVLIAVLASRSSRRCSEWRCAWPGAPSTRPRCTSRESA